MIHDGQAYIFLTAGRKVWHHNLPNGWVEVAFERFNHVECGVFRKPVADLTDEDNRDWLEHFGEAGVEFVSPSGWQSPRLQPLLEAARRKPELDDTVPIEREALMSIMGETKIVEGMLDDLPYRLGANIADALQRIYQLASDAFPGEYKCKCIECDKAMGHEEAVTPMNEEGDEGEPICTACAEICRNLPPAEAKPEAANGTSTS